MGIDPLVGRAEVTHTGFPITGADKPMLGTVAMTGRPYLTEQAAVREMVQFGSAELLLLFGGHQRLQWDFQDVAKLVSGVHIMVAGIEITIVLQSAGHAASRCKLAEP